MDSSNKGVSLDEFIFRKLQPVRILVGYLNNEMALNEGDSLNLDRSDLDNIISTLEIFLEEYDRVSQHRTSRMTKSKKYSEISNKPSGLKAIA